MDKQKSLSNIFNHFLSGSIPYNEINLLTCAINEEDIEWMMEEVKHLKDPSEYFNNPSDNTDTSGFFLFLDLISALIISMGEKGISVLKKYETVNIEHNDDLPFNPNNMYTPWVVKYVLDKRFHKELQDKFLSKNPKSPVIPKDSTSTVKNKKQLKIIDSMNNEKKVVRDTEDYWELAGESLLVCELIPNPPIANSDTVIRMTHSNLYGSCDDVELYVRIGDPKNPTQFDDLNSHVDWMKAILVEELVEINGQEVYRSELTNSSADNQEIPWHGTFEVNFFISSGNHNIEIKVLQPNEINPSGEYEAWRELSGVLSDWNIKV